MSDIAELTVRIKADAAQLNAEMRKVSAVVEQSTGKMSSSFGGLKSQLLSLAPAISAVAFVSFAKGAFEATDRLNDLAERTGFAVTTLAALNVPLLQSGSSVEEFSASINKMNNMIGEAAKGGSSELLDTFDKLGLSITKLMQLSPEEQFYQIANSLNKIKNQAEFTNTGMTILRSFSSLAPKIREANGNMADFIAKQQEIGRTLTKEQYDKIDKMGDAWTSAWEHAKIGAVELLLVLKEIADFMGKSLPEKPLDQQLYEKLGLIPNPNVSSKNPGTIVSFEKFGPAGQTEKEKNDDIRKIGGQKNAAAAQKKAIEDVKKSLQDYTSELERNSKVANFSPEKQAGMEAYYKTEDLAIKAKIANFKELALKNQTLVDDTNKFKKAQEEAIKITDQFHDGLNSALTDAILNFNSASDAAANLAKAIAQMIIQRTIAEPLTTALVGKSGTSGGGLLGGVLGKIFSYDVGTPNVPYDQIAKIHKGEMIIPAIQANAIRSGNGGGSGGVTVVQNNNFASGVTRGEVANMLPAVAKAAHDAVFASIQRGGIAAKIVGVR